MQIVFSTLASSRAAGTALVAGTLLLLGACTSDPVQLSGPQSSWQADPSRTSTRADVVIFRTDKTDSDEQAPTLWGDDRLLGALLPGQYLSARFCGQSAELRIVPSQPGYLPSRHQLALTQDSTQFYRINKSMGQYTLHTVSSDDAEKALKKLSHQSHVINRQARDCTPAPAAEPTPAVQPVLLREVAIGADALFRFNSASIGDILPEGREALDQLAREIRESIQVERIRIVGHTDRLGSDAYNDRLSLERAEAVAAHLRHQGITGAIDVSGRGKRDPIAECRDSLPRAELIACLQPDRRVAIELWGLQEGTATPGSTR